MKCQKGSHQCRCFQFHRPAVVTEKEVSGVYFKEDALSSTVEAADAASNIAPAAVTAKEVTSAEREPATAADL